MKIYKKPMSRSSPADQQAQRERLAEADSSPIPQSQTVGDAEVAKSKTKTENREKMDIANKELRDEAKNLPGGKITPKMKGKEKLNLQMRSKFKTNGMEK